MAKPIYTFGLCNKDSHGVFIMAADDTSLCIFASADDIAEIVTEYLQKMSKF